MAIGSIVPFIFSAWYDNNGDPATGYVIYAFEAGTTTPLNTYSDVNLTTANAHPIVLNSAGRADVFLTPGEAYDFYLTLATDTNPPTSPIRTSLGVVSSGPSSQNIDVSGTGESGLAPGVWVYLSSNNWIRTNGNFATSSTQAQIIGICLSTTVSSGDPIMVRIAGTYVWGVGLTTGIPYYLAGATFPTPGGGMTATPPTHAKIVARAESASTIVLTTNYQPPASATQGGLVDINAQTWTGAKTGTFIFAALPTGIGAPSISMMTANQTKNNNVTPIDLTGMSFPVVANGVYEFCFVIHGITSATASWRFNLTGPAAPTAVRYGIVGLSAAGVVDLAVFNTNLTWGSSAVDQEFLIRGTVRNGANAGTVQLQFAQSVADATNTVVYAESYVVVTRFA